MSTHRKKHSIAMAERADAQHGKESIWSLGKIFPVNTKARMGRRS